MASWRRIFTSPEAWIESKAGASPQSICATGYCAHQPACAPGRCWRTETERVWMTNSDWPFPPKPPYEADDEGREEPDEQ